MNTNKRIDGLLIAPWERGRPARILNLPTRRPRLRAGVQTRNILFTINREQGLHLATLSGKEPCAGLKNHSPLEGESARQGRSPQSSRRGADAPSPRDLQG